MKKYLVAFSFDTRDGRSGFGNEVILEKENGDIYTESGIKYFQDYLKKDRGYNHVLVMNIIPLNN